MTPKMTPADELLDLLDIEQLEVDLFRGIGGGGETTIRIFGGHVIAQALMAAWSCRSRTSCRRPASCGR